MKSRAALMVLFPAVIFALVASAADEKGPVYTSLATDQASLSPEEQAAITRKAQAAIACDSISDPEALAEAFTSLSAMKWDRRKMGCGARYGFELAQANQDDIPLQLEVLGVQVEYFGVLDKNYSRLYSSSPVKDRELSLRWASTRDRSRVLLQRLEPLSAEVPEVVALRGIYTLASTAQESTEAEAFAAPGQALADLEAAVQRKPDVLDGAALLVLGQLLMQLPEFAGGDIDRAIELLQQGNKVAPESLELKVALIDAYIAERLNEKAIAVIDEADKIPAQGQNEQDYADALRTLAGQSARLGRENQARAIDARRERFLDAHPYLDRRRSTASAGHGGVDPITGEDTDRIQ